MKNRCVRAAAMLLLFALVCVLSNILAFTVDTPQLHQNIWQGCHLLREQNSNPQMISGFKTAQLDNYTGVLILKTTGYTGPETLLQKAFGGYRVDMPGQADDDFGWSSFCQYNPDGNSTIGGLSYSRYWHGYTLALRLLLCVFNLSNLQMLLYFTQLALFILVLHLMLRRGLKALLPAYFIAYFLLMPMATSVCLQYVPVSMLMLAACAALLAFDERIERAVSLPAFFALIGAATNYLDLLTFPMVSLGFPLVLLLVMRMRRGDSFRALFMLTALCGVSWAMGYALMWALKWLINGFVFGFGLYRGLLVQISLRASDNGGELSRIGVLMDNLRMILSKSSYLLILGLGGCASLAPAVRSLCAKKPLKADLRALNLLLPALAVCAWYIVMANHTHDHTYFTYRSLTVAVLALYAFIGCLFAKER